MNTSVNFEIAKLLKEKGFDKPVHQYYEFIRDLSSNQDKTWRFKNSSFLVRESDAAMFPDEGKNGVEVAAYSDRIYRDYNFKTSEDFISAPTIAEVLMWLYEKHGIWIYVSKPDENGWVIHWQGLKSYPTLIYFNSPTEAYSSAIEHTLKNLIK